MTYYTEQIDEFLKHMPEDQTNTDRVNLILALLDQSDVDKQNVTEASHFFADKMEDVDKDQLWPLQ